MKLKLPIVEHWEVSQIWRGVRLVPSHKEGLIGDMEGGDSTLLIPGSRDSSWSLPSLHVISANNPSRSCLIRDELCTGSSLSVREVSGHCLAAVPNSYSLQHPKPAHPHAGAVHRLLPKLTSPSQVWDYPGETLREAQLLPWTPNMHKPGLWKEAFTNSKGLP